MSITQTYFLAHAARGKLSKEAARSDHDLRLLVGHANLLDSLMIDLANAEQEQESWFNKSLSGAKEAEVAASTQHIETIVEEPETDWEADDAEASDSDSEYDEEESRDAVITRTQKVDDDAAEDDETSTELALTRTPSRHSPPELSHDADSDSSDDEQMPPSPPLSYGFTEKQRQAIATTSFYDKKEASLPASGQVTFAETGFYLPPRQRQATLIAAY